MPCRLIGEYIRYTMHIIIICNKTFHHNHILLGLVFVVHPIHICEFGTSIITRFSELNQEIHYQVITVHDLSMWITLHYKLIITMITVA